MIERLPVSRHPACRLVAAMGSLVVAAALVAGPASTATASDASDGEIGTGSTDGHRAGSGDGKARAPLLIGTVGPSFTIEISDERVPAGRYRLRVRDRSDDHNFHIKGDGVNERTRVEQVTKVTWRVRLREGTYRIQCDPHSDEMRINLKVTS